MVAGAQGEELAQATLEALSRLDGTTASAVSLLTGFSREQIDELGALPSE